MANVCLAEHFGSRAARIVGCPSELIGKFPWTEVDRRDLVRWVLDLGRRVPNRLREGWTTEVEAWLAGGRMPKKIPSRIPYSLPTAAITMIRARSNRTLHNTAKAVPSLYATAVYQRFMDEMGGHYGEHPFGSPAWTLADTKGRVVEVKDRPGFSNPTIRYDPLRMRNASARQATDLLGRILLHEE
jgi:hypothetical protein